LKGEFLMRPVFSRYLLASLSILAVAVLGIGHQVMALPTEVAVTPPDGARFLAGQRFDLRVEGRGVAPYSATLSIDGALLDFTSGIQNSTATDGITQASYGGFNLRGYSNLIAGKHTIQATFSDATGSVAVVAQFQIIDIRTPPNLKTILHGRDDFHGGSTPARNIIIMVGDGMGLAHRTAARIVKYGATAGRPNGFLALEQFPGTGLITTHSLNSIITDSAPGMSCYSTGNHANNNQEGVYPSHIVNPFFAPRVEYLAEYLHRTQGKSLGIVTTADIEDATPAANAVHTANRNSGTGIVDQYLDESDSANTRQFGTGLAVLMGGGRRWFLPAGQFGSSRTSGTDYDSLPGDLAGGWNLPVRGAVDPNRNLIQDFSKAGFSYVDTSSALKSVGTPDKLLGLFGFGNMNVVVDKIAKRRGTMLPGATSFAVDDYHAPDQPLLDEMTDAALRVLNKNTSGFVLMVEGAHIDKQAHMMDPERVIDETIEFDNAVAVARKFADDAGNTLIIVLADHECSGFSIIGALSGGMAHLQGLASDSAKLDPDVQPERQKLVGTYDAAGFPRYKILADGYPESLDIDGKLLFGYGASGDRFETWLARPVPVVDSLLPSDVANELIGKSYHIQPADRETKAGIYLRGQAVGKAQAVHTATDIPIAAYSSGRGAFQLFYGVQENTDVFFKLVQAAVGAY
jgi:alkaline phosphatase